MSHRPPRISPFVSWAVLAGFALIPGATPARAQDSDGNAIHRGDALEWQELGPGVRRVILYGDAGADGQVFAFRLEVQDGFEMGPHTHPVVEHMTVLSGRFWVGVGEVMDRKTATAYEAGSYVAIGAGVPAYMWAEGPTVVQVHGVGPLTTEYLSPPGR